jgi:hypothetical protein
VYRPKDGEDTAKNQETFQRARDVLGAPGVLALFPEGISHSHPTMQPLKTGAARIALGAEAAQDFALGTRVLPVGLVYPNKDIFRSQVAVTIGHPFAIAEYKELHRNDQRDAVKVLTSKIAEALATVVLEAESQELWRGFLAVASWMGAEATDDMAVLVPRAQVLAAAYRRLSVEAPPRAQALVEEARRFERLMVSLGVHDPFAFQKADISSYQVAKALGTFGLLVLPAVLGVLLLGLPYRLVGPLAQRSSRGESDVVGTFKLLWGLLLHPVFLAVEGALFARSFGVFGGLLLVAVGPWAGLAALRLSERMDLWAEALRAAWRNSTDAHAVRLLDRERSAFVSQVLGELTSDETAAWRSLGGAT